MDCIVVDIAKRYKIVRRICALLYVRLPMMKFEAPARISQLRVSLCPAVKSRAMLTPRGVVFASNTDPSDVFMSAFFLRPLTGRGDISGDDRGGFDWRYPARVF